MTFSTKGNQMVGPIAAYIMAFSAMLFAAVSALTLIYAVKNLDAPEIEIPTKLKQIREPIAV
jgi:hypothetical protein